MITTTKEFVLRFQVDATLGDYDIADILKAVAKRIAFSGIYVTEADEVTA